MGCGCIVALLAMASPRLALFVVWLFTDRLSIALDSFWVGLLGFLFLPWTLLAWAVVYAPVKGVTGFGWFLVIFAFIVDLSAYGASARARRSQPAA
ncbi:MAG: hypothetical protein FJW88_03445 [Actinobacteria bacterium]|nr:hypothetical protein [Actinomycetota bacterium]